LPLPGHFKRSELLDVIKAKAVLLYWILIIKLVIMHRVCIT